MQNFRETRASISGAGEPNESLRHPHRFGVQELSNADQPELSAVPGMFNAAERDARVRGYHLVDEDHSGFEFVDEALLFFFVVGPGAGAQAEADIIGQANGLILILYPEDGGHRAEEFFTVGG